MIPELGHFTLILALVISLALAVLPLVGTETGQVTLMRQARPLAFALFGFIVVSYICLTYAFMVDDFTVKYVANNSNTKLPWFYKFSAVWGAHEGSLLLWALVLAGWTGAVALFSRKLPLAMVARVLAVMGMVSVGFLAFTLFTSNPFDRYLPTAPVEGSDLNPLLQDPGLIFHPPMLYMGYVGFSVAFAFAIAALISGQLDSAWARWSRPWTNVAWAFLTLGIALGSWWAYYELGWGGWWFWDPVENASFMPWLVGTALVHSLSATEKRGVFKSWTVLLAIFAFSLSLLGTFLVRSGVLTSVHAFANDPDRGMFILFFLLATVGGSLTLYAFRAPVLKPTARFGSLSREVFVLINNFLMVLIMLMVLLGTLYPLLADALGWGKVSVGPPYYNFFFVPLMAIVVLLMAPAPLLNWKDTDRQRWLKLLRQPALWSVVAGIAFPFIYTGEFSLAAAITVALGMWVLLASVRDMLQRVRNSHNKWLGLRRLSRSYYGMVIAHLGVAVTLVGVGLTTVYTIEKDLRMDPGDSVVLDEYRFQFEGVSKRIGPNFIADQGQVLVYKNDRLLEILRPEKRNYLSGGNTMTEAAIDGGVTRDLFVALGEPLSGEGWAVRIHYKAFVQWIWFGSLLMALGGTLAASDKRYRVKVTQRLRNSLGLSAAS